jgi:hypothetical protein
MDIEINDDCINMMIIPLDDEDAISLEEYLTKTVVHKRAKDEFVVVLADSIYPSLISYGLCEADRYNELVRAEVNEWIVSNGREWMRNNDFTICH